MSRASIRFGQGGYDSVFFMRSQIEREQDDGDYAANGIRDRRGEDNQFRTVWVTRDYGDRIEEIHQRNIQYPFPKQSQNEASAGFANRLEEGNRRISYRRERRANAKNPKEFHGSRDGIPLMDE